MSKKAKRTGYPLNSTRRAAGPADAPAASANESHSSAADHHADDHKDSQHGDHHAGDHKDSQHGDHHAGDHHKDDHSHH